MDVERVLMGGKHAATTTAGAWTARREGDPAVRLRGEFYRVLFRVLRDAVFITDGTGGFLDANPAARALSGYTLEELRALRLVDILRPEMPGRWLTEPVDHSLRCRDGARKLVELHVSVVVPDVYFYVLRDVTDLRRLEIRVAQSERLAATSHLLANVVHELNNHLTVVRGQAALLCQSSGDGPLAERARKIALAAERSLGALEDLLALARQRPPEHLGEPSQVVRDLPAAP